MADYPGVLVPASIVASTLAIQAPTFRYAGDVDTLQLERVPPTLRGTYAAGGGGHSIPAGTAGTPGRLAREYSIGYDWFDRVHLIPRKVFAFGNVVANVQDTFELFSAWGVAVSLTSFVNNLVDAGVTVPDLPATPATLDPYTGFTDPASPGKLAYTAPGFAVSFLPLDLLVAKDGVPVFDDVLEFFFGTGQSLELRVTGTRIAVITAIYEEPLEEEWELSADVIESDDGHEQVLSLVSNPVQYFTVDYLLDGTERQRLELVLHGNSSQVLALPLWHEDLDSTAAASAAGTSIAVQATTDVDFRVGGYAIVFESPTKYDVVLLSAVATNLLTFTTTPLANTYAAGVRVAPIRLGHLIGGDDLSAGQYQTQLQGFQLSFRVIDNDTGMFAGSVAGWGSYSGKVLLDDPNVMGRAPTMAAGFRKRVTVIDNALGRIDVSSDWLFSKRTRARGFLMRSRADVKKVKQLLLALRGPQVSFRLLTFADDLTVVATLSSASLTMDVSHVGYSKFAPAEPRKVFRITFTDGTHLVREIQSAVEVSATVERLTLNTTWPTTRLVSEVVRVQYAELCRFATDRFVFRHERAGLARLTAPTRTLVE